MKTYCALFLASPDMQSLKINLRKNAGEDKNVKINSQEKKLVYSLLIYCI